MELCVSVCVCVCVCVSLCVCVCHCECVCVCMCMCVCVCQSVRSAANDLRALMCVCVGVCQSARLLYNMGSKTGGRGVVEGVLGEKISAITENGRNSQNVPFETELQLSDGNIILCIKIPQIPLYFVLQGCISFL